MNSPQSSAHPEHLARAASQAINEPDGNREEQLVRDRRENAVVRLEILLTRGTISWARLTRLPRTMRHEKLLREHELLLTEFAKRLAELTDATVSLADRCTHALDQDVAAISRWTSRADLSPRNPLNSP
jgi:hypothetical protein